MSHGPHGRIQGPPGRTGGAAPRPGGRRGPRPGQGPPPEAVAADQRPRRERGGGVCRLRAPGEPVHPLRPGLRESARAQGVGRRRGLLPQPQGRCGKRLCAVYRPERYGQRHHRPPGVPDGRPGRADALPVRLRAGGGHVLYAPGNVHHPRRRKAGGLLRPDGQRGPRGAVQRHHRGL